jgi:hypothetical protein
MGGVNLMNWTRSDEQLYQALTLEQHLSTGADESTMEYVRSASFPCVVYEILMNKGKGVEYYWKMPRRWYADPLDPWNLVLLILWIPVNIVYFCFQGTRTLASARNSLSVPRHDIVRLESHQLSFSPSHFGLSGPIPYSSITSLGYYANGLRIDWGRKKFLLSTEAAPSIFVTLRHLAPGAAVASGLIVPKDFVERCSKSGHNIDVSRMCKNSPQTWVTESKDYNPPYPAQAIVGYGIIAIFTLLLIVLFV